MKKFMKKFMKKRCLSGCGEVGHPAWSGAKRIAGSNPVTLTF